MLYLIRSRFYSVGKCHTYQFEPIYMSFMANRIAAAIDLDIEQIVRKQSETKSMYLRKKKLILLYGKVIRIRLTEKWYNKIY